LLKEHFESRTNREFQEGFEVFFELSGAAKTNEKSFQRGKKSEGYFIQ
jgi:hypothetical protein